jgi:multicomponent Na+:H+ antiporter subunit G
VTEWLAGIAMLVGSLFMLLAALGVLRMPDVYIRMQATTKAATLGAGGLLLAVALYFEDVGVTSRALLALGFVFLTIPISAFMICRAAYLVGVPLWKGTVLDELRGQIRPGGERPPEGTPEV